MFPGIERDHLPSAVDRFRWNEAKNWPLGLAKSVTGNPDRSWFQEIDENEGVIGVGLGERLNA